MMYDVCNVCNVCNVCLCMCVCLSVCLSVCLPVCLSVFLSLSLSVSCPFLSCPVLSCPVLSCPVLSCPVLSCPALPCPCPCPASVQLRAVLYLVALVEAPQGLASEDGAALHLRAGRHVEQPVGALGQQQQRAGRAEGEGREHDRHPVPRHPQAQQRRQQDAHRHEHAVEAEQRGPQRRVRHLQGHGDNFTIHKRKK